MTALLPQATRRAFSLLLKLIGVVVFVMILRGIDVQAAWDVVSQANVVLLVASFAFLLLSYIAKTVRWHALVKAGGLEPSFTESWRLYTIGIFLGNLTPSNVGELGRIPYLRKRGMALHTATMVLGLDRFLDVIVMGVIAVLSVGVLYGNDWLLIALLCLLPFVLLALVLWRKTEIVRTFLKDFGFLPHLLTRRVIGELLLTSVLVWVLYFCWTIVLARALGIDVPVMQLAAAITLTAAVALVPIAPAGLGTRDAAMLTFLVPLGVDAEQSVAFSLLFFVYVILSCIPGLISWLQGLPALPRKTEKGPIVDVASTKHLPMAND